MNSEILVRAITQSVSLHWRALWDCYNAFYARSGPTALPDGITRTTGARFFDENEPLHALLAELDGRIAGIAHYLFQRSMIAIEPVCYMQDLFTANGAAGAASAAS